MRSATIQTRARYQPGKRAGFTFAEVLAALVFMAIVIPVAMEGLRVASRAGVQAERKGVAVRLADGLLNERIVDGTWSASSQRGTFAPQWPGYQWTLRNTAWGQQGMRLLTAEVTYPVQNQDYAVRLSTLITNNVQ
jgi:general secretion pathway protein I